MGEKGKCGGCRFEGCVFSEIYRISLSNLLFPSEAHELAAQMTCPLWQPREKPCPKCGRGRSRIAMFGPDQWYCNICDNPMQATEGEGEVDG